MCEAALKYAKEHFAGVPYLKGGKTMAGLGSCHLVHEGLINSGVDVPFWSTDDWLTTKPIENGFKPVATPRKGDIVVFGGHVAFYVSEGHVYTSSIRGGVCEVENCWFGKVLATYRYLPKVK